MPDNVLVNLILILAAAAVGGALALRLKQPIILGYLIAGLAVGPFTPGPRADFDQFRFLTEVGLALLLFVLGAGMSRSRFRGLGRVILLGGSVQIALTIGLGILFTPLFGLNLAQGFLLGTILAQSSSAVIARVLDDRGETQSVHGRIAVGISVVQDLSSLPLLLLLMVFLGESEGTPLSLLSAVGQVLGLAVATYIVGLLLWPRFLGWFGRLGSGELTLLVALSLALGGGIILQAIGLSFALGAFLAGLVIAESQERPAAHIARVAAAGRLRRRVLRFHRRSVRSVGSMGDASPAGRTSDGTGCRQTDCCGSCRKAVHAFFGCCPDRAAPGTDRRVRIHPGEYRAEPGGHLANALLRGNCSGCAQHLAEFTAS